MTTIFLLLLLHYSFSFLPFSPLLRAFCSHIFFASVSPFLGYLDFIRFLVIGHVQSVRFANSNKHNQPTNLRTCTGKIKKGGGGNASHAKRDATGAKPGKPQIAVMSHSTQLPQLGHRRPSQKLSLAQLLRCDALAIWRTILTFSTAKLYKGAIVAYKFVQVVSNHANIMVT